MDAERLRRAFACAAPTAAVADGGTGPADLVPAAVLIPVVLRAGGKTVLLTRRTAHLRDHSSAVWPTTIPAPVSASPRSSP